MEHFKAVDARHVQVEQDYIGERIGVAIGILTEQIVECLLSVAPGDDLVGQPAAPERALCQFDIIRIVFNP